MNKNKELDIDNLNAKLEDNTSNINEPIDIESIPSEEISDQAVLDIQPLVSVHMITYNHELFIAEAIEGVVNQETEYPFELIIGEDCSADRTREIVMEYQKNYPEIIRVITSNINVGVCKNSWRTYKTCRGKYIAICEGDDYWTDPYKLQKQVNFLETNQEYGLVYSKVRYYYQSNNKFARKSWGGPAINFDQLIKRNQIPTLSVMLKKTIKEQYQQEILPISQNWDMGDYPAWLYFALKSKIYFMKEETAVYRVLDDYASHSTCLAKREAFVRSSYAIMQFFLEYANIEYDKQELKDSLLSSLAANALINKNRHLALSYFMQANKLTTKNRIKRLICGSRILSLFYSLLKH